MLYVNQERLNTGNRSDKYEWSHVVKDYHQSLREIKEYFGDHIIVETKVRPRTDAESRGLRYPGPRGLLKVSTVTLRDEEGNPTNFELRYSDFSLQEKDGRLYQEDPNLLIKRGEHSIDVQRNPDLAYYVWRCGKVGRTTAEGKKFHIRDDVATHKGNAKVRRMQGKILHLIYEAVPESNLRTLAKSWGVSSVGSKDIEVVREELFEMLQANEKTLKDTPGSDVRGYDAFINSAEVKLNDQIGALIRDAEDAGKLVFDKEDRRWELDYKDGRPNYVLKDLSGDEYGDPFGALVNYLLTEEKMLRKVENIMGVAPPKEIEPEPEPVPVTDTLTVEQVEAERNANVLKGWLRKYEPGLTIPKTMKADEVRVKLIRHLVGVESTQEA